LPALAGLVSPGFRLRCGWLGLHQRGLHFWRLSLPGGALRHGGFGFALLSDEGLRFGDALALGLGFHLISLSVTLFNPLSARLP